MLPRTGGWGLQVFDGQSRVMFDSNREIVRFVGGAQTWSKYAFNPNWPGVEDAPAGVGQAAQLQVEVLVGAFQHAVGVVQVASDQPRAAAAAEGAQAAAAVVDRGGAQVQLA